MTGFGDLKQRVGFVFCFGLVTLALFFLFFILHRRERNPFFDLGPT